MHELKTMLSQAIDDQHLFNTIVNAPFNTKSKAHPLGLSIVVLLLVNKNNNSVQRIALADTDSAKGAMEYSVKPFNEIEIPLTDKNNAIVNAIATDKPQRVTDWYFLFTPELTAEEARFNQAGAGIATSIVYPLENTRDGGALIFSYVLGEENITSEYHAFMRHYTNVVSKHLR